MGFEIELSDEPTGGVSEIDFEKAEKYYVTVLSERLGLPVSLSFGELRLEEMRRASARECGLGSEATFGDIALAMMRDGTLESVGIPTRGWKEYFTGIVQKSLGSILCGNPDASWQEIQRAEIVAMIREELGIPEGQALPLDFMVIRIE